MEVKENKKSTAFLLRMQTLQNLKAKPGYTAIIKKYKTGSWIMLSVWREIVKCGENATYFLDR